MDLRAFPLAVEAMRPAHIPAVMEIEHESFSLPWPERAYRHELTQNEYAYYYVLGLRPAVHASGPVSAWRGWWQRLLRRPITDPDSIIGYGGFWLLYDEAHISTLAVRASQRRQGLGELLLVVLLDRARHLRADRATLEVRVSNVAALALYAKYGFEQVGRRKAYYADNQEDALIMTTPEFSSPTYRELVDVCRQDLSRRLAQMSLDKILQLN